MTRIFAMTFFEAQLTDSLIAFEQDIQMNRLNKGSLRLTSPPLVLAFAALFRMGVVVLNGTCFFLLWMLVPVSFAIGSFSLQIRRILFKLVLAFLSLAF